MKQTIKLLFLLLAIILPAIATATSRIWVGGICYLIYGDEAAVTSGNYSGNVTIPESIFYNGITYPVTSIGESAFSDCNGLTGISIPNSVTSIEYGAFYGCYQLKSISIPNSVTFIGGQAFAYCEGLTNVFIPNSVTIIGSQAFKGCSALSEITIPNSVTTIGSSAFYMTPWYDNQPDGLVYAGLVAYKYKGSMPAGTSIVLNDGTLGIACEAFCGFSGLVSVHIPNTVTIIGEDAFANCSALSSVDIPNSVIEIGHHAFYGCSRLTDITIPNSVTEIGWSTFAHCNDLTTVTIGESVRTIDHEAFNGCDSISKIICLPVIPPAMSSVVCFTTIAYQNAELFIPRNSVNEYMATDYWHKFNHFYGINIDNNGNILADVLTIDTIYKELEIDESFILNAAITPTIVTNNTILWTSSNTSIASVDENGIVIAVSPGMATVTAMTIDGSNLSASCLVKVNKRLISSLLLNKTSNSLYVGETEQLIAIVSPSDATDKTLTWSSSNSSVATVDNNGLITAVSVGTAIITVTTNDGSNLSATCIVTVDKRMATSISLNQVSATLYTGETLQLSANVLPTNADDRSVTWTSSNPSVATVSSSGFVTAVSAGNATITARTADGSNLSASCSVSVKQLATSIALSQTEATIYTGNTLQLAATVSPSTTSNPSVTWTSSNTSVATVSSTGLVTAKSTGNVIITAKTSDGSNLSATCNIAVKQFATSISLNQTEATIYTGNTLQLSATVSPSTTSNPSVTWTSSNTSIATVSSTGLVIAKSTGTAVITAKTADGTNLSASCNVIVKQMATSISLNKTSATLYLDQTVQLTATIYPYNTSDKSVSWSSSDNSIATVSSTGLVTAITPGQAIITATTADGSNLSATCAITVNAYVTSLTLDQSEVTILEGDTITLSPTILPSYATNQSLYWSSSNSSVVYVNNGVVVGRTGGDATITARTADGSNISATCKVTVVPNFDISMPNFSHLRGSVNNKFDLTIDLVNRYEITGMQFDLQLPTDVTIAKESDGEFNIWLDDARKSRNHTATASLISGNTYRILVSSATANNLKGHSGTVVHIMIEIPIYHVSGNKQVKYSNIILSEPDETRHTLPTKYSMISYYYMEGDANADVSVDVADYVITGNYILQNGPENFWYDAANVDHNSIVDVNDLTGITNIALGRREGGILQMPAMQASEDIILTANPLAIEAGQTKTLNLYLDSIHEFAGFQMDIQLPKGIRLVDASLVDENSCLRIATAELSDGSIRLLASSFSLKSLEINYAAFLKLTLTAENYFIGNDVITLGNIKFSERNMNLHTLDNVVIPVGSDVSGLEQVYSVIRIYAESNNIIIDTPESGTARIVTISGITQLRDVVPGHNVIPMDDSGFYIVTLNGTTAKLRLN